MKLFVIINLLALSVYTTAQTCEQCKECLTINIPKDNNGKEILHAGECSSNEARTYSSFSIYATDGYNGCGYTKDINDTYSKCVKECQSGQKTDGCNVLLHAYSSFVFKTTPPPKSARGERCLYPSDCEDGLVCQREFFKCLKPTDDCTPCGQTIEPNKPCCDSSGIDSDGKWYCASGGVCRGATDCGTDSCCISGSCVPRGTNGC